MGYGVYIPPEASERELRFSVELAQLAGFCSMGVGVPPVIRSPGEALPGMKYLCAAGYAPGVGIVPAPPGEDAARAWLDAYKRCHIRPKRASDPPDGYVSATDNRIVPPPDPPEGGLERLFLTGWSLSDRDGDDLPDHFNLRFYFPNGLDSSICEAACCLAMRFGCELTRIDYPLVSGTDEGDLVVFTGHDVSPELRLERCCDRHRVVIDGAGEALAEFMREFALKFSIPVGAYDLADTTCHIAAAVGGKNPDGEAAYIAADKPECAVVSAAADIEHFRVRFPSCELHAMNEPMLSFSHEYAPEGETERAATLLNRALELICPGDSVELTGALWQSAEVRRGIEKKFTYLVESTGARCDAKIICAYKQGQSWLEESFAPRARDAGAARVLVRFDASGVSGVIYNEDGLELVPVPEKPPRRLREMYPADELAAAVMGIGREAVTFEGATALPHSYEAVAFDALGNQVLADAYSVRSHARRALDALPETGTALVPTGFVRVEINGKAVLDERVQTDAETLWDIFQDKLLPMLLGRTRSGAAPFWHRAEIEAALGGVERELSTRCDHISSGETLEDSLNQTAKMCLMRAGRATGHDLSCPGLVLPLITTRDGAPRFAIRIYDRYANETSSPKRSVHAQCTRVTFEGGKLWLQFNLDAPESCVEVVHALTELTGEGFTELAGLLSPYGKLSLRCAGGEYSCEIPEAATPEPLDIHDIDLMPDQLIGYDDCERIVSQLRHVPGLNVWRAASTVQGRNVWAVEPAWPRDGYVSRTKRLSLLPTLYINGRHHANEVSATNAAFALLQELLTNPRYREIYKDVNIVVVPMENADGAALHYELQKVHPNWQHQCCYTNSLGGDLMPAYFDPEPLTTEALAFTHIAEKYLPDAFIDLHGVPHHEIEGVFDAPGGYRGLWLPRALLCAFYYHVDDGRFASNRLLSEAWKRYVNGAMHFLPGFGGVNDELEQRFMKYSWNGTDELYASERSGAMLNYWIPSPYDDRHPYPSISRPWTFSVMFTAEAADETAHGTWLDDCARAHLAHTLAGLDFMARSLCVMRDRVLCCGGTASVELVRIRPILPPEV